MIDQTEIHQGDKVEFQGGFYTFLGFEMLPNISGNLLWCRLEGFDNPVPLSELKTIAE